MAHSYDRAWIVIRRCEGGEYFDMRTTACTPSMARRAAELKDVEYPGVAELHPIIRTVRVRIEEIEE